MRLRSTPIPMAAAAGASPAVRGRGGYQNRCAALRAARRFCIQGGRSPPWTLFHSCFVGGICLDTDSTTPISASWIIRAVPP